MDSVRWLLLLWTCHSTAAQKVRISMSGNYTNENSTAGKLEVNLSGVWKTVCGTGFDAQDAKLACDELGFPNSQLLVPAAFGIAHKLKDADFVFVLGPNCTGNESSMADCDYPPGECPHEDFNYASVLCAKFYINDTIQVVPLDGFPSTVEVNRYGISGAICTVNFDDVAAGVLCRQMGKRGGVAFGAERYATHRPMLVPGVKCNGTEAGLEYCEVKDDASECRLQGFQARVFCYDGPTDFQVRLAGGRLPSEGRVEINLDSQWGTICDWAWTEADATVLCRQLNYRDGHARPTNVSHYGQGTGPMWFSDFHCRGDEKSIWSCEHNAFRSSYCEDHSHDASVYCTPDLRLDPKINYGAVQHWTGNRYLLFCADGFDDFSATVVCRTLGFKYGKSICCSAFGQLQYDIGYRSTMCYGDEPSILYCSRKIGPSECKSEKYASAVCYDSLPTGEFELRNKNPGPISVSYLGVWGYICANGFNDAAANVTCRQLGYSGGFAYKHIEDSGRAEGFPWLSNLNCTGEEASLSSCGNVKWGYVNSCEDGVSAAAHCYSSKGYEFYLSGSGGNSGYGRAEIAVDGKWGTICGPKFGFTEADASVFCKQMNFWSGHILPSAQFGKSPWTIHITDVKCRGSESSFLDCPMKFLVEPKYEDYASYGYRQYHNYMRNLYDQHYFSCESDKDKAAVYCYNNVRLAQFNSPDYGILEMRVNGAWSAICDDGFQEVSAKVACRQLDFTDGKFQTGSTLGPYNRTISVAKLLCIGHESDLDYCRRRISSCSTESYVTVYCSSSSITTPDTFDLRVVGDRYYGTLEANAYGFWGPICPVGWDNRTASAACRQLGYLGGVAYYGSSNSGSPMVLGRFRCAVTDETLRECQYDGFSASTGCHYPIQRDTPMPAAGVLCYNDSESVQVLLSPDGVVEIMLNNGTSGRICNSTWSDVEARVVCRQLHYGDGIATSHESNGTWYIWMDYVKCDGAEKSLFQCSNTWRAYRIECSHAGVLCST